MPGCWGQPLMEWFCPTSHTGHGQQPPFPQDQPLSSGCHNTKSCVPSQGSSLGAPNPAVPPCPAPPPCFPKKFSSPRAYSCWMISFLLAGGSQDGEEEPLPLPAAPKPRFAPGQVWVLQLLSGVARVPLHARGFALKFSYWELDFRCLTHAHQQFQLRLDLGLV